MRMNPSSTDANVQLYDPSVKTVGLRRVEVGVRPRMVLNDNNDNATTKAKDGPVSVEQLNMNAQSPFLQKQRRLRELKRHAMTCTPSAENDVLYRTVHPSKLDVLHLVCVGSDAYRGTKKSQHTKFELSMQDVIITSDGSLSKKYQVIHGNLRQLLRSISDGSVGQKCNTASPRRILTSST
jgi:hypothetical protein